MTGDPSDAVLSHFPASLQQHIREDAKIRSMTPYLWLRMVAENALADVRARTRGLARPPEPPRPPDRTLRVVRE